MMSMIVPTETLVKYDNPVLVSKNADKKVKVSRLFVELFNRSTLLHLLSSLKTPRSDKRRSISAIGSGGPLPGPPKGNLPPVEAQKNQQTEEILNSILPPREWSEEGQLWKQCVSSTPATRLDVMNLQVVCVSN